MKKTTLIMALMMTMALLIAFAGCGSSGSGDDSQDSEPAEGALNFETTDLDGNSINSRELFAENKVTMINVWGTYCGPCIEEMPDLEKISKDYAGRGAAVVGVVIDVPSGDSTMIGEAKAIMAETGVDYMNLNPWGTFDSDLMVTAIPTTIFVDSQGKQVGETIVGAYVDGYRTMLDSLLKDSE